jgi:hypothetical protein
MKYSRITLGSIDDIANEGQLELIGKGRIKEGWFSNIRIRISEKNKKIHAYMPDMSMKGKFLDLVNTYLKNNRMYLSSAIYRHNLIMPNKITGIFYKEKEK